MNKVFKCTVCGYIYDEDKEGTPFEKLPDDWKCPVCEVSKDEFEEIESEVKTEAGSSEEEHIVIIGSGFAGTNLAQELHSKSDAVKITLITKEKEWFYSRPLLTRAFYNEEMKKNMYIMKYEDMADGRLVIHVKSDVVHVNPEKKEVLMAGSQAIGYDKLVFATGSKAFIPPSLTIFKDNIKTLNHLEDYEEINAFRGGKKLSWAIVGGGFIGCELSSEFNKMGDDIDLFHIGDRLIENILSVEKSQTLKEFFNKAGINVFLSQGISEVDKVSGKYKVDGRDKLYDGVILAAGFVPRIKLAKASNLECGRGIIVDEHMETSIKDVFAVGDVAEINGRTYPFLAPISDQVGYLSDYLLKRTSAPLKMGEYPVKIKIHDLDI